MEFRLNTSSVSATGGNAARPSISSLCRARTDGRKLDQQSVICHRNLLLVYAGRSIDLVLITLLFIVRKSSFGRDIRAYAKSTCILFLYSNLQTRVGRVTDKNCLADYECIIV